MKSVAQNRRARYDYEILETVEAGLRLTGQEVKSCRLGNVHLAGSYVSFLQNKPILKNTRITPYAFASGVEDYNPHRDRELLLKASEIARLKSATDEKGIAIVPLELKVGRFVKIVLGLGRGRKRHDKRQKIKDQDVQKKLRRGEEY